MWLHDAHGSYAGIPVTSESASSLLKMAAAGRFPQSDHGAKGPLSMAERRAHVLPGKLIVGEGFQGFSLPLVHSEALWSCGVAGPVVAIILRMGPRQLVWLLQGSTGSAEAAEDAARQLWLSLGLHGAMLPDLVQSGDVKIADVLGSGTFGKVMLGAWRSPLSCQLEQLAVKELSHREARLEVELLLSVQGHNGVAQFASWFAAPTAASSGVDKCCIATLLCSGGCLYSRVMDCGPYMEADAIVLGHGLASALAHIHARGVVHRDLKAENVLLNGGGRPVLIDFGLAARLEDSQAMTQQCGSLGYTAPEVLSGGAYSEKVDVFSAAVVLYFAATQAMPWDAATREAVWASTLQCKINFNRPGLVHKSVKWQELLGAMFSKCPQKRPEASELVVMHQALHSCAQ
mmetsp:Transcript_64528/g.154123  ORF Transcript_64528/g.154123 Transcript_64528/m.154123 type:complete len:403 (+) Transcript_64528:105-1313(+)